MGEGEPQALQRFLQPAAALILVSSMFAQSAEPALAPPGVILQLKTEGGQQQFHVGELIPVQYSYSADIPDKYLLVSQSNRLLGGRGLEISCSQSGKQVEAQQGPSSEIIRFGEMLYAGCGGVGSGGSIGGGCGGCGGEFSVKTAAISFGPVSLSRFVRLRAPGTYSCTASTAEVTTTPPNQEIRPALLVKSNAIELTIIDDPTWAHSAAVSYADAYGKLCRHNEVLQGAPLQCFSIAEGITNLDTAESLATEVKLFDGRNHGWENGFWQAIQQTSYPKDALRLMTKRIQDPDFQVDPAVLESLAFWELRIDSPDAFQTSGSATYHAVAIEKLRKYVRLLGSSLARKSSNVLMESAKTYRTFAEQEYCEQQPLIPKEERDIVLDSSLMP